MDVLQIVSLVGGFVVLVGLLRAHRKVVETFVIPEVVDEEDREDDADGP